MFYLYHSNDLELLKELLLKKMQEAPAAPFAKEAILVQSQGMSHWLKLQLAQGLGVAAQIEFPLPSKFIWQVFNALNPNLPERSHFDKQVMAWKLMQLLPNLAGQDECAAIAQYLQDNTGAVDALKGYQLAQNIADVFDQYLIYRPEWLLAWEAGSNQVDGQDLAAHAWQPVVWRALLASTPEYVNGKLPREHRARVHGQLQNWLEQNPQALAPLPKRLFVFGIASLPKVYWQVLHAISAKMDVHFYLLNPCNEFAGDIVNTRQALQSLRKNTHGELHLDLGNPLLASWGKLGRDFLKLVQDAPHVSEFDVFYQDETRTHLLSQVQRDIFNLHDSTQSAFTSGALTHSQFKKAVSKDDGSIRFVSAHSPLREVQRLYDQILYWLDTDKNLKPRDIVVMVPDINQYAPYIDAVFSSHKATIANSDKNYRIPWAIADQAIAMENPIIDSFLNLLKLPESRFLNSEVMDFLGVAAVARRFDLSQDDIEKIQSWLVHAQIRWGLDGAQREALSLPNFEQNSWRQGLKQLLLGALLPDFAQSSGYCQDYPVFATEGNDSERLGKLMAFIDQLENYRNKLLRANLQLADWQTLILELLEAFYAPQENEIYATQSIRQALEQWQNDTELANYSEPIAAVVVQAWFNDHLGQQAGWQRFLAGPVNFCSLMPMRSIPFKALCMLGMNDSDYPRRTTPLGFDLIQRFPQAGDRARRDDDRYLFLEALCSAQDYLYLSYRGRDIRQNNELQPSVLLAELRDYLADGFCLQEHVNLPHQESRKHFLAWLQEDLPLQPYNPMSFTAKYPRFVPSYQELWAQVANVEALAEVRPQNWPAQALSLPADLDTAEVRLKDVVAALSSPPKFFVRRRLQAYLEPDWQELQNTEPFAPNKLDEYLLKQSWLEQLPSQAEFEKFDAFFLAKEQGLGNLAVSNLGRIKAEKITESMHDFAKKIQPFLEEAQENKALECQVSGVRVLGELQQAYSHPDSGEPILLSYRVGQIKAVQLLEAWLKLLFVNLAGERSIQRAYCYGLNEKGLEGIVLTCPAADVVQAQWQQALQWYWRCWQEPIAHLPEDLWKVLTGFQKIDEKTTGGKGADKDEPLGEDKKAQEKAKIISNLYEGFYQREDIYVSRCLAGHIDRLPNYYESWLNEYAVIFSALLQHAKSAQEEN